MTLKPVYGLTHRLSGEPIRRESRTLKVGIGLPKGKALHVWIDQQHHWCVQSGEEVKRFDTMEEARDHYRAMRRSSPERKYPQRLNYFTFTKMGPEGSFEPDFQAIQQHGPLPTEVDIVLLKDDPFDCSFQMWTASELKCKGDGKNAERVLSMAKSEEERKLADKAEENGERYFPITEGCWEFGCPYRGKECRPKARLEFQLLNSPRLGSTAYFDTTGFGSIQQIFSSLSIFREITQGIVSGIPLKMVLRPYRVQLPDGKTGTQQGVSLEFRADNAMKLKESLIGMGADYRSAGMMRLLQAGEVIDIKAEPDDEAAPEDPDAIVAEFYPDQKADHEEFENGHGEESKAAPAMPQRKSASAPAPTNGGAAPAPIPVEVADGKYLDELKTKAWACTDAQKAILVGRIDSWLKQGHTPKDLEQLCTIEFGCESPVVISGGDRITKLLKALR